MTSAIAWDSTSAIASPKPEVPSQVVSWETTNIVPAKNPPLKPVGTIVPSGTREQAQEEDTAGENLTEPQTLRMRATENSMESRVASRGVGSSTNSSANLSKDASSVEKDEDRRTKVEPDEVSSRFLDEHLDFVPVRDRPDEEISTSSQPSSTQLNELEGQSTLRSVGTSYFMLQTFAEAVLYPEAGTHTTVRNPQIAVSRSAIDLSLPQQLPTQSSVSARQDNFPTEVTPEPDSQPLDSTDSTNELGDIRKIRPAPRQPDLQLLLRSSVLTSSDIETSAASFGSLGLVSSAFLQVTPKLGADTRLVSFGGGTLVRGTTARYEFINLSLGVQQRLAPNTYAQFGWVQEQIYEDGIQRLFDNSIRLAVERQDRLAAKLQLKSLYELRVRFDDPQESSRVTNALGIRLRYTVTPSLEGALDYRLVFDEFITRTRSDLRQQVSVLTIYRFTPQVFISGSVSYLSGSLFSVVTGSETLNNVVLGISFGLNLY